MTSTASPPPATLPGLAPFVLIGVALAHMVNDIMQSLLEASYPLMKPELGLSYGQIGALTLAFMGTASVLQPLIGILSDKRPLPWLLPAASAFTALGLVLVSRSHVFSGVLLGAVCIGFGSSIFHPEASRAARAAAGTRFGLAQSVFQVGGNFGSSLGPLLAAFIVLPYGRTAVAWFALAALVSFVILSAVARWSAGQAKRGTVRAVKPNGLSRGKVIGAVAILVTLLFSKYVYTSSLSSFYTFYLIESFDFSTRQAQLMLFLFLGAMAAGTIVGGPVGDRIGILKVIWFSILGCLPFTLAMPHLGPLGAGICTVATGFIIASSFPAIVVFGQTLIPGRVGLVSGLFFGFAFGIGGLGAAALGVLSDAYGLQTVFAACAFLPALGILAFLLPRLDGR